MAAVVGENYADLVVIALVAGSVVEMMVEWKIVVSVAGATIVPQIYFQDGVSRQIIVSALALG